MNLVFLYFAIRMPLKEANKLTCTAVAPATCPSKQMQLARWNRMSRKFSFNRRNFHSHICFTAYLPQSKKDGTCLVHGLVVWGASCGGLGSYLYSEWAEWGLSLLVRGLSWGTGWAQLFPVCEPWLSRPEDTEARRTACLHGACRTGDIGCE